MVDPEHPGWAKKARETVRERGTVYGDPLENHGTTAALWSAYLRVPITAEDVCVLNILQKISRIREQPRHEDSWLDVIGYAINVELIGEKRRRLKQSDEGTE
jgi:hypothetical protein